MINLKENSFNQPNKAIQDLINEELEKIKVSSHVIKLFENDKEFINKIIPFNISLINSLENSESDKFNDSSKLM